MRWPYNTFMIEQRAATEQLKRNSAAVFVGKSIGGDISWSNSERYGCLVVSEGVGLARKSIEFLPTTAPTPTGENSSYSFLSSFLTTATGGFQLQSSHQDEAVICTVPPSVCS